jgi:hypothetical protein
VRRDRIDAVHVTTWEWDGNVARQMQRPVAGRLPAQGTSPEQRLVRRLELGRSLDATLILTDASEAERLAVSRLLGRPVSLRGSSLRVSPARLSAALSRAGIAPDLRSAVEALTGHVISHAEVASAESAERAAALASLASSRRRAVDGSPAGGRDADQTGAGAVRTAHRTGGRGA